MKKPIIINSSDVEIILRKDFEGQFEDHLRGVTEKTGATYFSHNLIQNYGKKGHRVSSFCNQDAWHDAYWEKYCYDDPAEKKCHASVVKNGFAVVSWKVEQETSPCCEERLKATQTNDGITFSFRKSIYCVETFSFGWNKLKTRHIDTEYILYLAAQLNPLREHHWEAHENI